MPAHPEDDGHVAPMPAATLMIIEEAIRVLVVGLANQHPDALSVRPPTLRRDILLPHDAQEQRAGAVHDSDVGQAPVAIIRLEAADDMLVEGVAGGGAQGVVADAGWGGAACPGGVLQ